jgi:hydrogenase-4 component E
MAQLVDPLLILGLTLNFYVLAVSRLRAVINAVALQGFLLGLLSLCIRPEIGWHGILLALAAMVLKGVAIPALLLHAIREVNIQRETNPLVSPAGSLLLGAVGTGLALLFGDTLPLAPEHGESLLVPASLATVLTGFLLLTTRRKAIMQVLGYLLLENGIFIFGLLLLEAVPFLVEIGVLLDLFTGVFVMGIIIHHINREFASESTEHLAELKD